MILTFNKWVFMLALLVISIPTLAQAFNKASASVQLTDVGDGLRWVDGHSFNPATSSIFFTAQPSVSAAAPPQNLYEVSVDGGSINNRSLLPNTARNGVQQWLTSPDGNQIVYRVEENNGQGNLFAVDTSTGSPRQLTYTNGVSDYSRIEFTSDNERIIYHSRLKSGADRHDLYSVVTDGSEPPVLLNTGQRLASYEWALSEDGKEVFFAGSTPDGSSHLYRSGVTGLPAVQLTEHSIARPTTGWLHKFDATFSRYAYFSDHDGNEQLSLFTRSPGYNSEVELRLNGEGFDPNERFEMHGFAGDKVIFDYSGTWPSRLLIADTATGIVSTISDGKDESTSHKFIGISPSGESILFSENLFKVSNSNRTQRGLFKYDVKSGQVLELGTFVGSGCCLSPRVTFSPRGDTFIIQDVGFPPTLFATDGSEIRKLVGSRFFYDKTGSWLLYADVIDRTQQLFAELVESDSTRRQLTYDETSDRMILNAQLSSDGSALTYIRVRSSSPGNDRRLYVVRLVPEPSTICIATIAALFWSYANLDARFLRKG